MQDMATAGAGILSFQNDNERFTVLSRMITQEVNLLSQ